MPEYKLDAGNLAEMEERLNALALQGWKPILMSTVQAHPQAPVLVTVILEKVPR